MKAQDLQFTRLIQGAKQFMIPIFQRSYSWEISHCEQLWRDILRVGGNAKLESHFIGSAVYIPEKETSAAISCWLVIDGQQRITTLTLLLLALMRRLAHEKIDTPVSAAEIEDYYLINRYGKGEQRYKLLLTKADRASLLALIDGKSLPEDASPRIKENFEYFERQVQSCDVAQVYAGIQKLMVVDVCLQYGVDNPQMIFESMNSTGKSLTQADLIRNFVLMDLTHEVQTVFYTDYWRPMEVLFGSESYNTNFDEFMRFFLVTRTGNERIKKDDVYAEFKAYAQGVSTQKVLQDLLAFARYYCAIALGKEKDEALAAAFKDVRELKADTCYPMLMALYDDYRADVLSKEGFLEIVAMVESYVFRRAVCDFPTNSLRQTFAGFVHKLDKKRYVESARAAFLLLPSYRRFPRDEEFRSALQKRNLYSFNKVSYWPRRFENFGRKERVMVSEYTVEHIMPQELSDAWKADLGANWSRVHDTYLHTLGNLTLTGYNSEYSNHTFKEKCNMKGGFKESPLRLNAGLGQCTVWNEEAIKARAERLSRQALDIWPVPCLDPEVLEGYREVQKGVAAKYSLESYPHLQNGLARQLFEALRKRILALDECVREEFRKKYVAYKAETNFVDVVAQGKRLKLFVNINFVDVEDVRGICRDVTHLGRWGNGNVEVLLERLEDLDAVMAIVRQALELQLEVDVQD